MSQIKFRDTTINGVTLTEMQATTVRVALGAYMIDLRAPDALGDDEHGRTMRTLYTQRLREIAALMRG